MQDTLSIGRVLLSPCRLLSALLVSESSNRDVASQTIKYLEDDVSVPACKGQYQYQLVSLYTHHTHDIMETCQSSSKQMHCGTKDAFKLSVETCVKGGAVYLYNMMCQQEQAVEPVRTLDTEPDDHDQTGGPFGEVQWPHGQVSLLGWGNLLVSKMHINVAVVITRVTFVIYQFGEKSD